MFKDLDRWRSFANANLASTEGLPANAWSACDYRAARLGGKEEFLAVRRVMEYAGPVCAGWRGHFAQRLLQGTFEQIPARTLFRLFYGNARAVRAQRDHVVHVTS